MRLTLQRLLRRFVVSSIAIRDPAGSARDKNPSALHSDEAQVYKSVRFGNQNRNSMRAGTEAKGCRCFEVFSVRSC
jgi:hypothetical protein